MATLIIAGIYDLADQIAQHQPDLVISITDPTPDDIGRARRAMMRYGGPVVTLAFHDIDVPTKGYVAPDPSHLREVARAMKEHLPRDGGTVLVHCAAGVSRSPAIGLFVLGYIASRRGLGANAVPDIFTRWKEAARDCEPNRRILMMLGSEMGPIGHLLAEKAIKDVQENKLAARKSSKGSIF